MATDVKRFHELDALRGLASISVVFLHFMDMFYPFDFRDRRTPFQKGIIALTSPFYRGQEAVLLFFVLSGFVLALPYLKGSQQPYWTFLLRRIVRIYLPYLAALALAVLCAAIWHGHLYLGNWAETSWTVAPDWRSVMEHVLFIGNYNWLVYNRVFWSLVVEMRVSLLFPLLVMAIRRLRLGYAVVAATVCLVVYKMLARLHPGSGSLETIAYISVFIVGILLAQHVEKINAWYGNLSPPKQFMLAVSISAAYFCGHLLPHMSKPIILYGAVGAILLALHSTLVRRALGHIVPRFLGRISYSLYLVHVPVLYVLTFTLHTKIRYTLLFMLYIVATLSVAAFFYRLIERPCIDLGRRIGQAKPLVEQPIAVTTQERRVKRKKKAA